MVNTSRKVGIGTLLLVVFTAGLWLLLIPFYEQRCPKCDSANGLFSRSTLKNQAPASEAQQKCPYCAEDIQTEAIYCRYCHRKITGIVARRVILIIVLLGLAALSIFYWQETRRLVYNIRMFIVNLDEFMRVMKEVLENLKEGLIALKNYGQQMNEIQKM